MSKVSDLKLLPVWVSPDHLAQTASHVMDGHRLRALAVLEHDKLVGAVTKEAAASAGPQDLVRAVMRDPEGVLNADEDVRLVADRFVHEGLDFAFVVEGDAFKGIVTATMLLKELGRSFDPLTGLPWSDYLREWGVEHLRAGVDVTVLFVDLDQFGQFNKELGHIVGDRVLQRIADHLREKLNPDTDVLVRYGGDEFAIGTLRRRDDAELLADTLRASASGLTVEGANRPITFSVGVHGGRRLRERENMHYAATLDNLINIASRNCQAEKGARAHEEDLAEASPRKPYQVISIHADPTSDRSVTTVILSYEGAVSSGADPRGDQPVERSVAVATARALERAIPGSSLKVNDVAVEGAPGEQAVKISGTASFNGRSTSVNAEVSVNQDIYLAVAEAVIEATLSGRPAA